MNKFEVNTEKSLKFNIYPSSSLFCSYLNDKFKKPIEQKKTRHIVPYYIYKFTAYKLCLFCDFILCCFTFEFTFS